MANVEEEQRALQQALSGVSDLLRTVGEYDGWDTTAPFDAKQLSADVENAVSLRNRAASSLLRVAFTGEMSSGKSFLISALHRQMKFELILDDKDRPAQKYTGLLPSFTEPTSACPVSIEPISGDGETVPPVTLNVRFADSDKWEWIADNPAPRLVAAYLTDIETRFEDRKDGHRSRVVAEAQLLVPATDMAAKLYDLPGVNAPGRRHEMTARKGWHEADCFVYVTPATHALLDSELELITELYSHYKASLGRKTVFWIVTAIDTAMDLTDDDLPRWRSTVKRNTKYLRDFIQSTGAADPDFVGHGFIGVSPALEARSEFRRRTDVLVADEDISDSRMDELRRMLQAVIEEGAGLRHLGAVAAEASMAVGRYERPLRDMLASARMPYTELQDEISELERNIAYLQPLVTQLRHEFGEQLKSDIERIVSSFARRGLDKYLHDELADYINSANLLSPREVGQLEIRKTRFTREWIARDGGPLEAWIKVLKLLDEQLDLRVSEALSRSYSRNESATYEQLDLELLKITQHVRTKAQQDDLAAKATSIMAAVFPMAGAVVAGAGAATAVGGSAAGGAVTLAGVTASTALGLALAPVGIGMAAAGLYAWRRHRQQRKTSLDVMRREEIDALNDDALEAGKWFTVSTLAIGDDLIERAAEAISRHSDELRAMVLRRTERLNAPESQQRREHIESLSAMSERATALNEDLRRHVMALGQNRQ